MTWAEIWTQVEQHGVKTALAAFGAAGALGYRKLSGRMKKEREENKAGRDATRALLADRMIQQYHYRMEKGHCPIYARQSMEDMFVAYKALGGNGTIEDLYNRLRELPTEKEEAQ